MKTITRGSKSWVMKLNVRICFVWRGEQKELVSIFCQNAATHLEIRQQVQPLEKRLVIIQSPLLSTFCIPDVCISSLNSQNFPMGKVLTKQSG